MQDHPTHLHLDRLEVGYGTTQVLRQVSLDVPRGSFTALLGASGSGKTTLLRAIAGFETPAAGRILCDGRDITAAPAEARQMAMVFQSYALWPHKTVDQHLAYGLRLRRRPAAEIAARIAELRALLGLEALGNRKPAALSGGQRQRVALGRALAIRPDILLLDEPLSNLDARIRLQLRGEIRALQQRLGITAILVTHDREEAMAMADRIVILDRGRIAQTGTPEAIWTRPENAFVAAFMGAENRVMLMAGPGGHLTGPGGIAFAPQELPPAGPVEARFRPEAVELSPVITAPGALAARARVTAAAYLGHGWSVTLDLGGTAVTAMTTTRPEPGAEVVLQVPPAALFLFPAASPATGRAAA